MFSHDIPIEHPMGIVIAAQMAVQLQTSVVPCAAPAAAGREYVQTTMAVPNRNAKGEEEGVEWYFLQWWWVVVRSVISNLHDALPYVWHA
jgi:hypothetical protein